MIAGQYHQLTRHLITFYNAITYERVCVDSVYIMHVMRLAEVLVLCGVFLRRCLHLIDNKDFITGMRPGVGEAPGVVYPGHGCVANGLFS
jgi:hypothetical protein